MQVDSIRAWRDFSYWALVTSTVFGLFFLGAITNPISIALSAIVPAFLASHVSLKQLDEKVLKHIYDVEDYFFIWEEKLNKANFDLKTSLLARENNLVKKQSYYKLDVNIGESEQEGYNQKIQRHLFRG